MARNLILVFILFSGGLTVGSAVAAFITMLKILPRMVQITQTLKYKLLYQYLLVLAAVVASLIYLIEPTIKISSFIIIVISLSFGIFYGFFTFALAELVNVIPVFAKRFKFKKEIIYVVFALIFGKVFGALYYFFILIKQGG